MSQDPRLAELLDRRGLERAAELLIAFTRSGVDALVHRDAGPLATFDTAFEAGKEMVRVLQDEPDWRHELMFERREFAALTGSRHDG